MHLHANAKLGLAGRLARVRAIDDGLTRLEKNALLSPERRVQRFLQAHGKAARKA